MIVNDGSKISDYHNHPFNLRSIVLFLNFVAKLNQEEKTYL